MRKQACWGRLVPCERLASLRFFMEGGADRSAVIPGTLPRLAPEEPREALSRAKVSLASLTRPHGGWSQEALLAGPPPEREAARWVQVPGSEGPWDTLASSSLAHGAAAGQYARRQR